MGSRGGEDMGQGGGRQIEWTRQQLADETSHIHIRISQEEQLGSERDRTTQGSSTSN